MVSERGTGRRAGARRRTAKDERCTGERLDEVRRRRRLRWPLAVALAALLAPAQAAARDPGAAEAERLPRRQRPRHDDRIQRIRRTDRQAPGAAADLPSLGQQPQRGLRTLARNRRRGRSSRISTADDQTLAELITPQQIALGVRRRLPAAAERLLRQQRGLPAYIRPLGEPNRCLNAWSAVNCDGTPERRRTHDRLVQAGLPPHRRDRPRRPEPGRDQRDPGGNRPAAGEPDQRAAADRTAGGAGEHRLEPAARRLAAGQRQLPRQLLARAPLGRLGRHRLLLRNIPSGKTSTASTPASSGEGKPVAMTEWAVSGEDEPALRQAD